MPLIPYVCGVYPFKLLHEQKMVGHRVFGQAKWPGSCHLGKVTSLAPFPFYTSQYSRYANMVPVNLLLCTLDCFGTSWVVNWSWSVDLIFNLCMEQVWPGNTDQRAAMYNRLLWWAGHFAVLGVIMSKANVRCHRLWFAWRYTAHFDLCNDVVLVFTQGRAHFNFDDIFWRVLLFDIGPSMSYDMLWYVFDEFLAAICNAIFPFPNMMQVRATGSLWRLGPVWLGLYRWSAGEEMPLLWEERLGVPVTCSSLPG